MHNLAKFTPLAQDDERIARLAYEAMIRSHEEFALGYARMMGRGREGIFVEQFKQLQNLGREAEKAFGEETRVHNFVESSICAPNTYKHQSSNEDGDTTAQNLHRFIVPAFSHTMLMPITSLY